jgi:hypothetical protein
MKNIHVLPTDKPSRLSILNSGKLNFGAEAMSSSNSKLQHIYITSDEEVKEDDWIIWNKKVVQAVDTTYYSAKKIILTTDLTLIADGVRAIDDIFLEWFVENPSCEEIKVELHEVSFVITDNIYKIIIPQEEPKQETIEEAARRYTESTPNNDPVRIFSFIAGAKWQAERMYSEEDMKNAIEETVLQCNKKAQESYGVLEIDVDYIFEQFKKKGGDK